MEANGKPPHRDIAFFLILMVSKMSFVGEKTSLPIRKNRQFLVKSPHETPFLSVYKDKDNISDFKRS